MKELLTKIIHIHTDNTETLGILLTLDVLKGVANYSILLVFIVITTIIYKDTHYQKETLLFTLNKHKWFFSVITSIHFVFFIFIHLLSSIN
jgi:hypothetical protein